MSVRLNNDEHARETTVSNAQEKENATGHRTMMLLQILRIWLVHTRRVQNSGLVSAEKSFFLPPVPLNKRPIGMPFNFMS